MDFDVVADRMQCVNLCQPRLLNAIVFKLD